MRKLPALISTAQKQQRISATDLQYMVMRTLTLQIGGMHCQGCETIIEHAVAALPGVRRAKADYSSEVLIVTYDATRNDPGAIVRVVEDHGYECSMKSPKRSWKHSASHLLVVILAVIAMGWILVEGESIASRWEIHQFEQSMSYGMLFLVGLFTGFHCVGMCGGFVVSYTADAAARGRRHSVWPHVFYGLSKTLSYTLIGGSFGLLGSIIAFTPEIRGVAAILAGVFLILFGLHMLDWFPALHRIGINMPRKLARFVSVEAKKHRGPFAIGLLNGLMIACGPLQAMYVMAAGTGSFREGAMLLLVFGTGTLPMMFGFGMLASVISGRLTRGVLKISSLLVVGLGLIMLNRGLLLAGTGYDFRSLSVVVATEWESVRQKVDLYWLDGYQTIHMEVTAEGYTPDHFVLKQGVPVRWIIEGKEITQCNHHIVVPSLKLEFDIKPGKNEIEFTPQQSGVVPWSCWMGMIPGTFMVEKAPENGGEKTEQESSSEK